MSELLNLNLETVSEISALELRDRDGKYVVQIKNDGTLIFAPGITPDKASEQFWRSIAIAFPEAFVSRQTYADLERENARLRADVDALLEELNYLRFIVKAQKKANWEYLRV